MRVLIIGAGIGGACLAHGLQKNGVEVTVFERNSSALTALPGYGIHINVFGQQAMRECLPAKDWQVFETKAKSIGGGVRFYDERLRLLAELDGMHLKDGQLVKENRLSISRTELRDILLEGLKEQEENNESIICWEKEFDHYETLSSGKVRAYFKDGSSAEGDVLVGADASNSRVRKQYLPSIERLELGITIIVGRTRLTPELTASLPPSLIDGSPNSIVPLSSDWLFISVWRAPVNTAAASETAEIDTYVVWAYVAAADNYPGNLQTLAPTELCQLVLSRITGWNPDLSLLVRNADLGSVAPVPLRSMPHLPDWTATQTVLLGDAIHNMTPMAGIGANTALRDARLITQALICAAKGQTDLIKAIEGYERQMREYANEAVGLSLRNARNAVTRSVFKRRLFRFLLGCAQRFSFFKRLLFPVGK